MTNLLYDSHKQ